jgi:hypothetical protein
MRAFINTPVTREQFLKEINWHYEQDAFIRGSYGEGSGRDFSGCAVGCSINSFKLITGDTDLSVSDHCLYEKYIGVPEWLALLEDEIFEGLPDERRKQWPLDFAHAINEGAELDKIKPEFLVFILEFSLAQVQGQGFEEQKIAIQKCIKLWKRKDIGSEDWLNAARSVAESAWSAESAAWSVAWSAARSAAWSARSVAWSAARSAAWSARSAESAAKRSAAESARSVAFEKFAYKLLGLMRNCN